MSEELTWNPQEIVDYLLNVGFTRSNNEGSLKEGDTFTREILIQPNQTIVINGQAQQIPPKKTDIVITYVGTGSIDDSLIYGFSVGPDKYGDIFYIQELWEMKDILNRLGIS